MGVAYDFGGKVAVVTGAGGGIGQAYAEALAGSGASVVVADIDVADPGSAAAMAALAGECYGDIDYLVNNATIFGGMQIDSLLNVDWDYLQRFPSVNLLGALVGMCQFLLSDDAAWVTGHVFNVDGGQVMRP